MLVNMCHPSLQPGIKCNKPSYDGYEVENLVKEKSFLGNNGFMVERFIKAPANVTLQFPCNVHIFKICINPFVGSQKSLGFEIFTNSENVKHSWLIDSTADTIPVGTDGCFVCVGKTLLTEATNICFRNYKFDCRETSQGEIPSLIPCKREIPLTHHLHRSLQNVSHVMVRITRTAGSSVPCIGKIEVWAKPAANLPKQLKQKLYSCFTNSQTLKDDSDSIFAESPPITQNDAVVETLDPKPVPSADIVDFPEDFIDPLTCDIMSVPMLLPSGQSIDQSTLENFINAEAKWGRAPSNPFTGIRFSKTYKAVQNISLKVRIDKFLMEHGSHFPNISRTVGRASDFHNQHMSANASEWVALSRDALNGSGSARDKQNPAQSNSRSTGLICPKDSSTNKIQLNKSLNSFNPQLKNVNHVKLNVNSSSSLQLSSKRDLVSVTDQGPPPAKRHCNSTTNSSNASSHENSVTQSLNSALSMALSNLPTFLSPQNKSSDKKEEKTTHDQCDKCASSELTSLYTLPCKHTMCNQCLKGSRCNVQTTSQQYICSLCGKSFPAKDVCRLYI